MWANGKDTRRQSALVDVLGDISLRPSFWLDLYIPVLGTDLKPSFHGRKFTAMPSTCISLLK